ncbi:MAG: SHOCT domain-containing protein [Akkermansiaceae bacterium]|nr:SHOCT domain-containing protein [Akkermansiaceae bacterium]
MSLSDELQRLAELRASGALTDSEFEQAKAKLLKEDEPPPNREPDEIFDHSVGRAANRYVTFQMVMAVIGVLIFLFVIAPRMCSATRSPFGPQLHMR